jgi:hypothetical protein
VTVPVTSAVLRTAGPFSTNGCSGPAGAAAGTVLAVQSPSQTPAYPWICTAAGRKTGSADAGDIAPVARVPVAATASRPARVGRARLGEAGEVRELAGTVIPLVGGGGDRSTVLPGVPGP